MTVNVSDWSDTPSSNTTVDGINIGEGCPSGNINNALRSIMAGVHTLSTTIPSSAAFMPRTGGAFTGPVTYSGALLSYADAGFASGRIYVQAAGGSPPAMSNGDLLIEI